MYEETESIIKNFQGQMTFLVNSTKDLREY